LVILLVVFASQALASSSEPAAPGGADRLAAADTGADRYIGFAQVSPTLPYTSYFPLVMRSYWTERWEEELFQDYSGGWPWGAPPPFAYGYKEDGDKSKVYHIGMDGDDDLAFVTGPMWVAENFEYDAQFRRAMHELPLQWYDECGILVSPVEIDPYSPSGSNVYSFGIRYRIGSSDNSSYIISKWTDLSSGQRDVLWLEEETHNITDEPKFWNWFTISRIGDTLYFTLKRSEGTAGWTAGETSTFTPTDATLPDVLYVGFYAYHATGPQGDYRLEFQYDEVKTHSARY
jgi:hypothetical protein